jgi:DNA-binding MarR family transcriptional regulator
MLAAVADVRTMGRMAARKADKPKRRKSERKESNVHIRVTEAQKAAIEEAAARSGLGASSWMLMLAMREIDKAERGGGG